MTTDLTKLDEVRQLGGVFKQSGYFKDIRDEAQAIVKILYGRELGLSPVVSMMSIHIIEGKPELSANLLASQVKSSEHYDYRVTSDPKSTTECAIEFLQDGEPIGTSVFTIDDAKTAGIYRNTWTKYPKAMLFARAMSQGVRLHCPDVGMGVPLYVEGEISGTDPKSDKDEPYSGPTVKIGAEPKEAEPEPELPPDVDYIEGPPPEEDPIEGPFITYAQGRAFHDLAQEKLNFSVNGKQTTESARRKKLYEFLESKGYTKKDDKGKVRGSTKAIPARDLVKLRKAFIERADNAREAAEAVNEVINS